MNNVAGTLFLMFTLSMSGMIGTTFGGELSGRCWQWSVDGGAIQEVSFDDLQRVTATSCDVRIGEEIRALPRETLWRMELNVTAAPASGDRSRPAVTICFVNGERWLVRTASLQSEAVRLLSPYAQGPIDVPLETVTRIGWDASVPWGEEIARSGTVPGSTPLTGTGSDQLELLNGDRLYGELSGLDHQGLQLQTELGRLALPLNQLRLLRPNSALIAAPVYPESACLVQLRDGTLFYATELSLVSAECVLRAENGVTLVCSSSEIAALDFVSTKVRPLAFQSMIRATQESYFGEPLPQYWGATCDGGPLVLGERRYPSGVGVRAASVLTFAIPVNALEFWVHVGLAPGAENRGAVRVRVVGLDEVGREADLVESTELSPRHPKLLGPMKLKRTVQLSLVTEFGSGADVLDLVNWCVPTLGIAPNQPEEPAP